MGRAWPGPWPRGMLRALSWLARLLLALIRGYQLLISPLLGRVCRFEPSCSRYTAACIERHGAWRGAWWGLRRIARCHPWNPGGWDPPPAAAGDDASLDRRSDS